jgi:predicted Zn-dependent peptidase
MTARFTVLANGLTVATDPMTGVETATLGVWVGSGTRNETAPINGVAHMLEHMAFKGTRTRSAFDIAAQIEAVGGFLNAYTGRESTAYYAQVLGDDVPIALEILSDILLDSVFDEEEIERERSVILQELGQSLDTPDDIIFDHFQETAFPNQGLGRPVLGRAEIIEGLGSDTVRAFMREHYVGQSMVLSAAGKVDHDKLVEQAKRLFNRIPSGEKKESDPGHYSGGLYQESRDLEQVHLVLGFEGLPTQHDHYYPLCLYSALLGGGMSSRLFQEVREQRGLAYSVSSFTSAYKDTGLLGIYAGTSSEMVDELVGLVGKILKEMPKSLTVEELDRARNQFKAHVLMSRESSHTRCEQLAYQMITYGRPLATKEFIDRVSSVEISDVCEVAEQVTQSKPTMVAIGPESSVDKVKGFEQAIH